MEENNVGANFTAWSIVSRDAPPLAGARLITFAPRICNCGDLPIIVT